MGTKFPHCMVENIDIVSGRLKNLGLCVGVWDKDPTKIFASCPAPMEAHSIGGVLACGDFKIVGVSPSEDLAQWFALQAILEKVVTHGILQLGCDLHVLGKCWLESGFRHDQILRACGVVVEEGARVPMFRSPSLFYVPKAKSDEIKNISKWCNMISQALHPLRPFSKLVGRCLSFLVKEINTLSPFFSRPAMIGGRDMFFVSSRARCASLPTHQLEMDIDTCCF